MVKAANNSKKMIAYKLNRTPRSSVYVIEYSKDNELRTIEVPVVFKRVMVGDKLVVDIKRIKNDIHSLSKYSWYYGEEGSKNLRVATDINDAHERNVGKLGWCRIIDGKYEVDGEELVKNLHVDGSNCPSLGVNWVLGAVSYFNEYGLLQSEVETKTLNDIAGKLIDDVTIDMKQKILTVSYSKWISDSSRVVLVTNANLLFNYSASITLDKYANKLIHLTIFEARACNVNVEIGIPGKLLSFLNLYHENFNQTHHIRINGELIGVQWVCAYPTDDIKRNTCVKSTYSEEEYPYFKHKFNFTLYSQSNNTSVKKSRIINEKKQPITEDLHYGVIAGGMLAALLLVILVSVILRFIQYKLRLMFVSYSEV